MNLSPNDVRRKQFDKIFRGYDPTEVDLFLKQVADELAQYREDQQRAEDRVRELEGKLEHYEKVELALQEALESARETVRRSEAAAEEKARLTVRDAELRAEKILHDAERERHGLRQDIVRLNSRQSEVAARLRGFLLSELEVLAQFQGDDPVGFLKLQSAGPAGSLTQGRLEAPIDPPAGTEATAPPQQEIPFTSPLRPGADPEPAADPPPPSVPEPMSPEPPAAQPVEVHATDEPPAEPIAAPIEAAVDPTDTYEFVPEADGFSDEVDGFSGEPAPPAETTGAYAPLDEAPEAPAPPPAVTGGWDLRSLVTGEERSVTSSPEERERIKRILDDLD